MKQNFRDHIFRNCFRLVQRKRPKELVRRRGYNDKGSMRLPHESEPSYPAEKLLTVVQLEERRALQREAIRQFLSQVRERLELEDVS